MTRKTGSRERVREAAVANGLTIEIVEMPASTRTAEEAAAACGCHVEQIVKSLVFEGERTGKLYLMLVSGRHRVSSEAGEALTGEPLKPANPRHVRDVTGFAIGGVAPIGHLSPIPTWIDQHLLTFATVWSAAGAPHAVFEADPKAIMAMAGATPARFS